MKKYTKENYDIYQIFNDMIRKYWEDDSFKVKLLNSPKEAIEEFSGLPMNVTDSQRVVANKSSNGFVEISIEHSKGKTVLVNIPPSSDVCSLELTDAQLEMVAGGGSIRIGNVTILSVCNANA